MLEKILNKGKEKEEYRSWYDLSKKEAIELEKEFTSKDMGKSANDAMHICIIIGIIITIIFSFLLGIFLISLNNPYIFTMIITFILLGIIIIVRSTIEYHTKFNSWLEINKKIIKK